MQIGASVLDLLTPTTGRMSAMTPSSGPRLAVTAAAARPLSMAAANLWFCTMISSSAFVEAYGYSVSIAASARSATC